MVRHIIFTGVLFVSLSVTLAVSAQQDLQFLSTRGFDGPLTFEDNVATLHDDTEPFSVKQENPGDGTENETALEGRRGRTLEEHVKDVLGLPFENHYATTEDGYILALHRIPNQGKPPVFLLHGLLESSWSFVYNAPDIAMAPRLHALGYDVWMGNSRGNVYSRNHTALFPDSREDRQQFFAFSWQDMARFDVPAMVDHVLLKSGYKNLVYVGHSQGTIQLFANILPLQNACHNDAPNLRGIPLATPRYIPPPSSIASKVKLFVALAPVAHLANTRSQLLRLLVDVKLADAVAHLGGQEFFKDSQVIHQTALLACKLTLNKVCELGVKSIAQTSLTYDNMTVFNDMLHHCPAGTSVLAMQHFAQLIAHRAFTAFDHGGARNVKEYAPFMCRNPPTFAVHQWPKEVPIALFTGSADSLAPPEDIALLTNALPKDSVVFSREYEEFGHFTFLIQKRLASGWLEDMSNVIAKHTPDRGGLSNSIGNTADSSDATLQGGVRGEETVVLQ